MESPCKKSVCTDFVMSLVAQISADIYLLTKCKDCTGIILVKSLFGTLELQKKTTVLQIKLTSKDWMIMNDPTWKYIYGSIGNCILFKYWSQNSLRNILQFGSMRVMCTICNVIG